MIEKELVNKMMGVLLIGLASAGYTNSLGMLLLANDSKRMEDYNHRTNVAIIMNGLFGLIFAVGILFITS